MQTHFLNSKGSNVIHAAMKKQCCLSSLQLVISVSQQDLRGQAQSCDGMAVPFQDVHWLVQGVKSMARMKPLLKYLAIFTGILS